MKTEELKPVQLSLNPDNDRHGSLKDEPSAIQWLLENRTSHMRALAEDLASTKRLYERHWCGLMEESILSSTVIDVCVA